MTVSVQQTFDDMGAPLIQVPFCVLDLETTGGSPANCSVTEVGAAKYVGGVEVGSFQTLVNPGSPIPPFITILTGITQSMVIEAPRIEEVLPAFLEFIGDAVIVGHNVRFDLSFLNADSVRLGYGRLPNRSVDTHALARRLIRSEVRNLKLQTLAGYFRSPTVPIHRALEDARATAWVLHALLERAGTLGVTALEDLLQLPTARGSAHYGKIRLTDALPRRPGVYLFKDRTGRIFYIGKAKNLRTRVRSYFYGDPRRTVVNMLKELDAVEHRVCSSELEAEVTELRLIHAHRPRYNRHAKPPRASHFVKLTRETYPRLSLVRTLKDDGLVYLGPYRSRRSAELVMTALWDAIPIRRCAGRPGTRGSECGFAQLGVAACPCDGSLTESEYRPIIERLIAGIEQSPQLLLDPLRLKMTELALQQRFEEAGWVRDRYRALAGSLERRRAWQTMNRAGMLWAETAGGEGALIERGRLTFAWSGGDRPAFYPSDADLDNPWVSIPSTVQDAEEAHLIWQWLTRSGAMLLESSQPLHMPAARIPELQLAA
ncbi:MAG TPA: DEDD exonuclease domain-containing protein [Acidimicrobiia bacterium]|nr:DEDD exonuclease domain-containing protein [Acidimicrobiia bacterium]